jgi:hypothetical protein
MFHSKQELQALQQAPELEGPLVALEDRLTALGLALHQQDAAAVERVAAELHVALSAAVTHFARAARGGGVPPALRQRLALAGSQVAAQREALARATASLDRAIDVLLPDLGGGNRAAQLYSAAGSAERHSRPDSLLA